MIDELLVKYYAGETSVDEQRLLSELLSHNSDPRYDADRRLICPLHGYMPDFGRMARRATRSHEVRFMRWGVAAASACVILIAATIMLRKPAAAPVESDLTVAEATEQTRMALMMISDAFERGFQELDNLNEL